MPIELPPINHRVINSMSDKDVFSIREHWIVRMVTAIRKKESDKLTLAMAWIVALTGEMRLRGGSHVPEPADNPHDLVT